MNHDITKQLKALKRITPHTAFALRSRAELLAIATPRAHPWRSLQWAGGFAFAVLFLFIATLSFPAEPTLSASLNENVLTEEFEGLAINIELQELTYRAATERAIVSAIMEIEGTEGSHLNTAILSSEFSSLESEASSSQIDALLEEVLE